MENLDPTADYFFIYSKLVSVLYYFVIDVTNLIEKFKFELFYKKEDTLNMKIKHPDYITKLKQIKSVILDKNQTITDNQLTISGLMIFNEFYEINDNEIPLLRDILSQTKNERSFKEKKHDSLREKKHDSLREIPNEDNDAESKIVLTYSQNPILLSSDSKMILNTKMENKNEKINYFLPSNSDNEEPLHTIERKESTNDQQMNFIGRKSPKPKQLLIGRLYSDLEINLSKPFNYSGTLKSSVLVDPYSADSEGDFFKKKSQTHYNTMSLSKSKAFHQLCDENFMEINELLQTLILCHFTKTKIDIKTNLFTHESTKQEISSILQFCEKFGYSFKGSFKITDSKIQVYEINTCSHRKYYPIIGFNEATKNRTRFSLIVANPREKNAEIDTTQNSTLYVHGDDADEMMNILNLSSKDKESLRERIEKVRETGNMTMIYAKRELTKEETKHYLKRKKIIKTSLTIKDEELESLYNSIEERLDLICVVCLKEKLRPNITQVINSFNEAQIKVYFVSGDNECSTLASAFQSGIITSESEVCKIQVKNQNAGLISLKWILQRIQKQLISKKQINMEECSSPRFADTFSRFESSSPKHSKKVGFEESIKKGTTKYSDNNSDETRLICILIDGESFRIIYKNKYLRHHFLFLMMFCSNVCFNFSAIDKKRLAKMIKQLENSTNTCVLGIGDGYDDVPMMQACDVSIEIKTPESEIVSFMGDFVIDDCKKISDLIFFRANDLFLKNEEIVFYLFYVILSLLINFFFFSWFSDFTGIGSLTPQNFDILTIMMSFQIIFVYFLFENKRAPFLTKMFPLLYKNDLRLKMTEFKRLYLKTFVPAIIDASIIFFFNYFSYALLDGNFKTLSQINMSINISFYFVLI